MRASGDGKRRLTPGAGLAIGIALGVALGAAMNKLAIGVAIGVALGVALDAANRGRKSAPPEEDVDERS